MKVSVITMWSPDISRDEEIHVDVFSKFDNALKSVNDTINALECSPVYEPIETNNGLQFTTIKAPTWGFFYYIREVELND